MMIVAGGLSGGLGSYVTGGSFWEGVRQGVISSSLNHALHGTFEAGQDPPEKGDRRMPQRGYGFEEVYNGTSWVADWNGRFYHASGQVTSTGSPFELLLGSGIASSTVNVLTASKGGTNLVYQGIDKAGVVRYVGITERQAAVRFAEHLNSGTAKSLLQYRVVDGATGLSRTGARVWEQTLINQYGLQKNGGLLLNKVNSIAPKNWWQFGIK
jgi:hypothetical protein